MAGNIEIVRDFQGPPVHDLEALLANVVHDEFGQRLHIGRDDRDLLGVHHLQAFDQRAGTGDDRNVRVVLLRASPQPCLGLAMIAEAHCHDGTRQA